LGFWPNPRAHSKGFAIWTDTETTGLDERKDQILEWCGIVEDSDGKEVERFEYKIKLKHNVIPGPIALAVNNINPYSRRWVADSMTEAEAVKRFAALCEKYTVGTTKPVFTAYNADFDKGFVSVALSRSGRKFTDLVNRSVFDPLQTVRKLTADDPSGRQAAIKTKKNKYGKASSTLSDAAEALGVKFAGQAHRAMADVEVMREVAKKSFKLATGHDMSGLAASPEGFAPGSVVRVVTDSASSGAKVRHLVILENDPKTAKLVAVDEDDIRAKRGIGDTCVRTFNYSTIVGQLDSDPKAAESLKGIAANRASDIQGWAARAKAKFVAEPATEDETKNFALIADVANQFTGKKDKAAALGKVYPALLERMKGDNRAAKAVLTKAEHLCCANGGEGWMEGLNPYAGAVNKVSQEFANGSAQVEMNPSGLYRVEGSATVNGRQTREIKDCKNKKEVLAFLKRGLGDGRDVQSFVDGRPRAASRGSSTSLRPPTPRRSRALASRPPAKSTTSATTGQTRPAPKRSARAALVPMVAKVAAGASPQTT
jgi:DNA polymerase III epsilon subunit-like protein